MSRQALIKVILASALLLLTVIFALVFHDHLSLSEFNSGAENTLVYVQEHPIRSMAIFMVLYFLACSLPMPFLSVPTVVAGFLFGNAKGLLIVSFASASGGTVLFLVTRYLFSAWVRKNFTSRFAILDNASNTESLWFAAGLRFVPGVPFFVPSMALSFSRISVYKFYLSTQLGMLFTLFVYVNAGSNLASINSTRDLYSFELVLSMLLIALIPVAFGFLSSKYIKPKYRKTGIGRA